ncbi:MAG: glycosyltransferase family 2 protein [Clostridia bacterium]|nr:glycosyltransferase family 2 protein [Clostridia bacterium]
MNYFEITEMIISVLYTLMGIMTAHFVFFAVVGIFAKKRFPETEEKLRYGILIPTRNEEHVVGKLIESIRKSDYPQDKLEIFVIAHNCTDGTAAAARAAGAVVYEYNNPNERRKGYAMRYLVDRINEDHGCDRFDGFFVFDADNVLDGAFISKMNDAFVANERKHIITSYRNSKNFGANVMSAMYGLYFAYSSRFEARGRAVMNSSTRVAGTGFLMNSEFLRDGWQYFSLSEDTELTADRLLEEVKVIYCDEAVFYDEQPTTFRVMWNQRLRWAKGHLSVFKSKGGRLVRSILTSPKRGGGRCKWSMYDLFVGLTPLCVVAALIGLLQNLFFFIAPLVTDVGIMDIYPQYLLNTLQTTLGTYAMLIFSSTLLYILERKRFPKIKLSIKIASVLLWPVFLLIAAPLQILAVFIRDVKWVPIPHTHAMAIENVNTSEEKAEKAPDLC